MASRSQFEMCCVDRHIQPSREVDIQQLYVHCTKKVPEYRYPLYFEKFKIRADFAMLVHAD